MNSNLSLFVSPQNGQDLTFRVGMTFIPYDDGFFLCLLMWSIAFDVGVMAFAKTQDAIGFDGFIYLLGFWGVVVVERNPNKPIYIFVFGPFVSTTIRTRATSHGVFPIP